MARWFRLRLTSVSGFPRTWRNIRLPCSVSTPRSSNRTGGFPASGSPTGFTDGHTIINLRPAVESLPGRSEAFVLLGRSQSQFLCPFHQRARSEAPLLHRHYPASTLLRASPPPTRPGLALAGCPLRLPPLSSSVSRASCAFLRYMPSSLPRRNCKVRLSLTSFATLAFPACPIGRLPHQAFRGLVERSLALRVAERTAIPWRTALRGKAKRKAADRLLRFLSARREMIHYPEFRERGWQIGSGPTESQCKLCTKRLKGYGRRWDRPNATAVAALDTLDRNGQWRQVWPTARYATA